MGHACSRTGCKNPRVRSASDELCIECYAQQLKNENEKLKKEKQLVQHNSLPTDERKAKETDQSRDNSEYPTVKNIAKAMLSELFSESQNYAHPVGQTNQRRFTTAEIPPFDTIKRTKTVGNMGNEGRS